MKAIIIIAAVLFAFSLETMFFRVSFLSGIEPPFLLLTIFYFLWHLEKNERIFFAYASVLFFEAMSLYPPGSYAVVFALLLSIVFFIKIRIIRTETKWARGVSAAFFLFAAGVLLEEYAFLIAALRGNPASFNVSVPSLFLWSLFWGMLYGILTSFFGAHVWTQKTKFKTFA